MLQGGKKGGKLSINTDPIQCHGGEQLLRTHERLQTDHSEGKETQLYVIYIPISSTHIVQNTVRRVLHLKDIIWLYPSAANAKIQFSLHKCRR